VASDRLRRSEGSRGVLLSWENAYASAYDVLVSNDGQVWTNVFSTVSGDGGLDDVDFPRTQSRYLKLVGIRRGTAWGYSLFEVIPKTAAEPWGEGEPGGYFLQDARPPAPDAEGRTWFTNAFFVPASWSNRAPFLFLDGQLVTRADAQIEQTLEQGYLPIPSVTWRSGDVELRVTAFAAGPAGASTTYARYEVRNGGAGPARGKLYLAARPFEINPPWQWNGYTRIHNVK
jgi:hypothetical protein